MYTLVLASDAMYPYGHERPVRGRMEGPIWIHCCLLQDHKHHVAYRVLVRST